MLSVPSLSEVISRGELLATGTVQANQLTVGDSSS